MRTVFDPATRQQLTDRINTLDEQSMANWGKMNVYQMLKHCTLTEEAYLGRKQHRRSFIGRIFGKTVIKNMLKDESPMGKNAPTGNDFKVQETSGDIETEKQKWIALVNDYANFTDPYPVHWFFGKLTNEQLGQLAYKHIDHHLRQFNS